MASAKTLSNRAYERRRLYRERQLIGTTKLHWNKWCPGCGLRSSLWVKKANVCFTCATRAKAQASLAIRREVAHG
jgi:hypothetical protein